MLNWIVILRHAVEAPRYHLIITNQRVRFRHRLAQFLIRHLQGHHRPLAIAIDYFLR